MFRLLLSGKPGPDEAESYHEADDDRDQVAEELGGKEIREPGNW